MKLLPFGCELKQLTRVGSPKKHSVCTTSHKKLSTLLATDSHCLLPLQRFRPSSGDRNHQHVSISSFLSRRGLYSRISAASNL